MRMHYNEVRVQGSPGQHLGGQGLYGFADFQQPDADSVEYQAVGQITSMQVGAGGIDGSLDVGQSLPLPVRHSATRSRSARARTTGLRSLAATRSILAPRMASRSAWTRAKAEQAQVRRQVHEQIDVAIGPVLATGHTAEDPQVGHLMGGGGRDQVPPFAPDLPPDRAGQPAQLRRLLLDIDHQVGSGRIDQPGQRRERRLSPSGFISADHALRDARPESQLRL